VQVILAEGAGSLVLAGGILGLLLSALALALARMELGPGAARRRRQRRQPVARHRHDQASPLAGSEHLTPAELARLATFRPRARLMADEPVGLVAWWRKVQLIWRGGHAGWLIAAFVGAFSMATHFGAFWLIVGGGWVGAAVITMLSTLAMVALCAWIMMGLLGRQP
jgi:hypothetical protein